MFFQSESSDFTEGLCLERRCVDGDLEVLVSGEWLACPYGTTINVSNNYPTSTILPEYNIILLLC